MSHGVFVDIYQQDGTSVRMYYPMTSENVKLATWIGIQEQIALKFSKETNNANNL